MIEQEKYNKEEVRTGFWIKRLKTCTMIGHELNIKLVEPRWAPSSGVAVHHPSKFEYAILIYAYKVKNVGSINKSKSC